jgi:hypothetical protein
MCLIEVGIEPTPQDPRAYIPPEVSDHLVHSVKQAFHSHCGLRRPRRALPTPLSLASSYSVATHSYGPVQAEPSHGGIRSSTGYRLKVDAFLRALLASPRCSDRLYPTCSTCMRNELLRRAPAQASSLRGKEASIDHIYRTYARHEATVLVLFQPPRTRQTRERL